MNNTTKKNYMYLCKKQVDINTKNFNTFKAQKHIVFGVNDIFKTKYILK